MRSRVKDRMQQITNSFQRWFDFKGAPHRCIIACLFNMLPNTSKNIFGYLVTDFHQTELQHQLYSSSLYWLYYNMPSKSYWCLFWVETHSYPYIEFWNLIVCCNLLMDTTWFPTKKNQIFLQPLCLQMLSKISAQKMQNCCLILSYAGLP